MQIYLGVTKCDLLYVLQSHFSSNAHLKKRLTPPSQNLPLSSSSITSHPLQPTMSVKTNPQVIFIMFIYTKQLPSSPITTKNETKNGSRAFC